jgi:hypothetical protein
MPNPHVKWEIITEVMDLGGHKQIGDVSAHDYHKLNTKALKIASFHHTFLFYLAGLLHIALVLETIISNHVDSWVMWER